MKRIIYDGNTWLVGDEAAEVLVEYAVLLAKEESADSVDVAAYDRSGQPQNITLLIGPATMMTIESSSSLLEPPDNADPVARVRERMRQVTSPPRALPGDPGDLSYLDDLP